MNEYFRLVKFCYYSLSIDLIMELYPIAEMG